ncbi:MAG: GNAT family N-acetyltransferase [Planctomycetaceae bacterium]|nr:GNAT family N-acetyltransferase [Planctomycetaceae bacterium]
MIFETARLLVRDLVDSDFDAFHEMQSDIEVMRYTTGKALDESENRRQLRDCIARYVRPANDFWVWAVVRKSDQQFIGTCAIVPNGPRAEIGYRLLRKFFGNGYGREICNGLIVHGIQHQNLHEIIAYADIANLASVKILDQSALSFVEETKTEEGGVERFYRWLAEPNLCETSDHAEQK